MNGFEEIEWMQMLYKVMYLTYMYICTDPRCPGEVIM